MSTQPSALRTHFTTIPVTMTLIALNAILHILTMVSAFVSSKDVVTALMNNYAGPLFRQLALFSIDVSQGQWWRVLTSGFLHFGPLHLLLNMYMLFILGVAIEQMVGRWKFLGAYLVSLLGGSLAVMMFSPLSFAAGASGALFGMMGCYAVLALVRKADMRAIITLLVLNVIVTFVIPGISIAAHLGGLATGIIVAVALFAIPALIMRGPFPLLSELHAAKERAEKASWVGFGVVTAAVVALLYVTAQAIEIVTIS